MNANQEPHNFTHEENQFTDLFCNGFLYLVSIWLSSFEHSPGIVT